MVLGVCSVCGRNRFPDIEQPVLKISVLNFAELVEITLGNLRFLWSHTHGYGATTWVVRDVTGVAAVDSPIPKSPILKLSALNSTDLVQVALG